MPVINLFDALPSAAFEEVFTNLVNTPHTRIERIISQGQSSPEGFWYDQEEHEWILLLSGQATIRFETGILELHAGDSLNIPAHQRHRVEWTSAERPTVWLAVFYR